MCLWNEEVFQQFSKMNFFKVGRFFSLLSSFLLLPGPRPSPRLPSIGTLQGHPTQGSRMSPDTTSSDSPVPWCAVHLLEQGGQHIVEQHPAALGQDGCLIVHTLLQQQHQQLRHSSAIKLDIEVLVSPFLSGSLGIIDTTWAIDYQLLFTFFDSRPRTRDNWLFFLNQRMKKPNDDQGH